MADLTDDARRAILLAATLLTGHKRRRFQAEMAHTYCGGSARHAETTFGWGRDTVHTGLNELRSGIRCVEDFESRGRTATEDLHPGLEDHIRRLVDPHAQADPKFQTPFAYTRVTARAVREAFAGRPRAGREGADPPDRRRHPQPPRLPPPPGTQGPSAKKVPQTDAIFAHVREARAEAAADPDALRISIDTKAKVKVGDFSRGGQGRAAEPVKAVDHDMAPDAVLVPFGVLELTRGAVPIHQPWFLFGHSRETSDFLADGLDLWWNERKAAHPGVNRLHVELDNGPEIGSSRTQFLKRMVGFVDRHRVVVELVYLPPYHSKYNPIERCWGILERHWDGALLSSVADVLRWAGTMTWRGLRPIVRETTAVYERGVRLTKAALRPIAARLTRSSTLPKWSLTIQPKELGR